jgi:hypothetical protein
MKELLKGQIVIVGPDQYYYDTDVGIYTVVSKLPNTYNNRYSDYKLLKGIVKTTNNPEDLDSSSWDLIANQGRIIPIDIMHTMMDLWWYSHPSSIVHYSKSLIDLNKLILDHLER